MLNKKNLIIEDIGLQLSQLDTDFVYKTVSFIITLYISNRAIKTYTLHKDYKPQNIKKIVLPPELKVNCSEVDFTNIVNNSFLEELKKFTEVITKNLKSEDLINFYNNINTLKTSTKKFNFQNLLFKESVVGNYDVKNNKILVSLESTSAIYHELLHMASSFYKDGIKYSGFSQASNFNRYPTLGDGINEGYTELLNRRYFSKDNMIPYSYEYEIKVAEKLETIIGKEKMESLYFTANLKGLINELNQYISEEEIMKLLSSTDFVLKYLDDNKIRLSKKRMLIDSLKNINLILLKAYTYKLIKDYELNIITQQELINKLSIFIMKTPASVMTDNFECIIMSKNELKEYVEQFLKSIEISMIRK